MKSNLINSILKRSISVVKDDDLTSIDKKPKENKITHSTKLNRNNK